jgi:formylglycine-generating enzyme required for sulfatase activity
MNRVLGEIAARKTELATRDSFIGMRAGEERDWEIAPGVKMTFCWCPPREFLMGSPETDEDRLDNEDQFKVHVTLTKGFWMAKTQVTQAQWQTVMGSNPSYEKGGNFPVENVSWDDTQDFLAKLNTSIVSDDGGKMVLPTEAQWEYACRVGELGHYSEGMTDQVANSHGKTLSEGAKNANARILHFFHGNFWEWCDDWYNDELRGGVDPRGADSGAYRVVRGGRFFIDDCIGDSAIRRCLTQSSSDVNVGFRVTRSFVI